jgi:hypothetical protein
MRRGLVRSSLIAMPASARLIAAASFAPSPAMVTTRPALQERTIVLSEMVRANTHVETAIQIVVDRPELRAGHHLAGAIELTRDCLRGARMIAGDAIVSTQRRHQAGSCGRSDHRKATKPRNVRSTTRDPGRVRRGGALGDGGTLSLCAASWVAELKSEPAGVVEDLGRASAHHVVLQKQDLGAPFTDTRAVVAPSEDGVIAPREREGSWLRRRKPGHP